MGFIIARFKPSSPKSEGWLSKKIVPYLNRLYKLIYNELDVDYLEALKGKNPLATIRVINNERYKKI